MCCGAGGLSAGLRGSRCGRAGLEGGAGAGGVVGVDLGEAGADLDSDDRVGGELLEVLQAGGEHGPRGAARGCR